MKQSLFLASILIEVLYITLFILTIKRPGFRFWPPPSPRSWQFFSAWILASLVLVGFFFTGLLDFNSAFLYSWARYPVGLLLLGLGSLLGSWSFWTFGLQATLGLGTRLITKGPYRHSRNPQYLADILQIIGYMVLTNSWRTWLIGVLGIVLNILAPFTEEPWLEERFGSSYLEYKQRVPRFFSPG
jgi:protein-S-isoprenylcysteine O-methyltransferase Ste14